MTGQTVTYARLRAALRAIGDQPEKAPIGLANDLVRALLDFGSETPDNLEMVQSLDVTSAGGTALCLKRPHVRLSRLIGVAVGGPIPIEAREDLPELTQAEWDAAFRICQYIFLALESGDTPAWLRLREALWAIGENPQAPLSRLTGDIANALREFGPRTPEFQQAVDQLEVSVEDGPTGQNVGLCLKKYHLRLSEVLWYADGTAIPDQVAADFPGLAEANWGAALRAGKLALTALESDPVHPKESSDTSA
ncbi:hypothetical protein OG607_20455 [Streptomyces sp. NBC_01537]|uniref:hypothetical protein n=1 Tax=Streptomyces sp. NBC_01537 TaxID=2903896 RepID=UPI0038699ABE